MFFFCCQITQCKHFVIYHNLSNLWQHLFAISTLPLLLLSRSLRTFLRFNTPRECALCRPKRAQKFVKNCREWNKFKFLPTNLGKKHGQSGEPIHTRKRRRFENFDRIVRFSYLPILVSTRPVYLKISLISTGFFCVPPT
jgi:hypothetical protein